VHILTKIFIVLVSLLSVMLVPLVVVYAYNENSWQKKFQEADASATAARGSLESAKASLTASEVRFSAQIAEANGQNASLRKQIDQQEREIRERDARLQQAEDADSKIQADLSTLSNSVEAGQKLSESLIDELRKLRTDALASERRRVELDEALRETQAQLDVSKEAVKALQEELQRMKNEHASSLDKLSRYLARHGEIDDQTRAGTMGESVATHDIDATVTRVRRSANEVLAEIDAGTRDGVKVGWVFTLGAGDFIANLRITSVDVNSAVGVVEMENVAKRGAVEVGCRAFVRAGR